MTQDSCSLIHDLKRESIWAYCLGLFGLPRHVHVVDQEGQSYGSVRRCCNRCGLMATGTFMYVNAIADWNRLPAASRCTAIGNWPCSNGC